METQESRSKFALFARDDVATSAPKHRIILEVSEGLHHEKHPHMY